MDEDYEFEKCAEQAFHIHKTFLQELNTYILALNNAGFEFELKVDKSYDPNAFKRKAYDELISFEEFIGRYPKIAQFRISLFYVIKN